MNRIVINVIVGIFVLALLILGLYQGMSSWGTAILGFAVGLMLITILPWHGHSHFRAGTAFALQLIGGIILLVILILGVAGDWTSRETALMGVAVGAVLASAFQSRPGSAA